MTRVTETVFSALKSNVPNGTRCLLAISGGIDSMVLMKALCALRQELSLVLEVAHVDHSLRESSGSDASFVKTEADSLGIPFHLKKLIPPEKGTNIESWGRKERYKFFKEICNSQNLVCTLTAHNANDVAETFLMRLLANKELGSIEKIDKRRKLLRPFLSVTRSEIELYAKEHKVLYQEDPTNLDQKYTRNKIRKTLIPFLENEFEPRIIEVISGRAQAVAADELLLREFASDKLAAVDDLPFGSKLWRRAVSEIMRTVPERLHWRIARTLLKPKLGFNLGRDHSSKAARFILGEFQALELPGGIKLRSHEGGIVLSPT